MRGVSKLVLEIRPEGDYFEKALLFLNPDKLEMTQKDINDNAEKLLSDISTTEKYRMSKPAKAPILIIGGIAAGAVLSWSTVFIIGLL
ncbi:MAG: hypothetical protein IK990_08855 [Ruminiclostridium sp.]|nr:hypothetical protein [Ruminiclostridium sp.]